MGYVATLASGNENKLRELQHALPGWEIELLGALEYPPETGANYYENALAKARFGRSLADPAEPGLGQRVRVVRRAGLGRILLGAEELAGVEGTGRRARYVCELVAVSPQGAEHRGTGVLDGRIAEEMSGSEGFGFDPVFIPDGEERTVAELGNDWKRENSHRARAARDLLASIMPS